MTKLIAALLVVFASFSVSMAEDLDDATVNSNTMALHSVQAFYDVLTTGTDAEISRLFGTGVGRFHNAFAKRANLGCTTANSKIQEDGAYATIFTCRDADKKPLFAFHITSSVVDAYPEEEVTEASEGYSDREYLSDEGMKFYQWVFDRTNGKTLYLINIELETGV